MGTITIAQQYAAPLNTTGHIQAAVAIEICQRQWASCKILRGTMKGAVYPAARTSNFCPPVDLSLAPAYHPG
jgi:hypothetical protein